MSHGKVIRVETPSDTEASQASWRKSVLFKRRSESYLSQKYLLTVTEEVQHELSVFWPSGPPYVRTYMTRAHWSTQRIVEINTRLHRMSSQINSCHQPHLPSETGFVVAPKYFYCSQKTCQTKYIFTWYSCVGICDTAQTARHVWEAQPAALRVEEG